MDTDITTQVVNFLTPCIPYLCGLGEKFVDKGAEKLGEKSAEGILPEAKKIWNKLFPKVKEKPAALEAAEDIAKNPDDADAVAALRRQIRKILEAPENALLAAEISEILADIKSSGTSKFNVRVENSTIGAIGDQAIVLQSIGAKSKE